MPNPSWPRIRKALENLEQSELMEVLKELYDLSSANKALLAVRFDAAAGLESLAGSCRKEIERAFWPARGFPSFKPGAARKAVLQFAKVALPMQALEMELYFVEQGIRGTTEYGDIDEGFYNSLGTMWLAALRRALTLELPEIVERRLASIFESSKDFGWGFSDEMKFLWLEYRKARSGEASDVFETDRMNKKPRAETRGVGI